MTGMRDSRDAALLGLLRYLETVGYCFIAPTPETHGRVIARKTRARDLRDIFGWSVDFSRSLLPAEIFEALREAGWVEPVDDAWRSHVRVSSLGGSLFVHSRFPTEERDAVFFGPDSYRFARFLADRLDGELGVRCVVDIGTGSGVGAIVAGRLCPGARLAALDVNPLALRFARVNAAYAGVQIDLHEGGSVDLVDGYIDLAIANPPYLIDPAGREYRHGGDAHGADLSLQWAAMAKARLAQGGRLLLYTGSAIVDGEDRLHRALLAQMGNAQIHYEELDPDVFGEELAKPGYEDVERIAIVGVDIRF